MRKISPPPGFDPRTVQPVGSRHTDYASRPWFKCNGSKIQSGNGQRQSGIEEDSVGRQGTECTVVRDVGEAEEEEEEGRRRRKKRKRKK